MVLFAEDGEQSAHDSDGGGIVRPKRLFGFDGTAGKATCFSTGSNALGNGGLSPATAAKSYTHAAGIKLQGIRTLDPDLGKRFIK